MHGGEPQLPDGVAIGEVLAGRYRVEAVIGAGAMGVVVAAHDGRLDIPVAIKFLLTAPSDRNQAVARLVREARAAARLQSEHVVRVSDVAVHDANVPYIVMERLLGDDLAELLRTAGPFAAEAAVDHILEACEAIAEAHRIDIIHRDLKPANLFLAQRRGGGPTIKVLDFGIAKNTRLVAGTIDSEPSLTGAALTGQRAILGSPLYMSPEQMESSGEVDARTDIWALGVTLFELVAGKPPFTGTSLVQVYARMTAPGEPPWFSEASRFSPGLLRVIEKCLKRERASRYATVGELAVALVPFGSLRAKDSAARIRRAAVVSSVGMDATLNVVSSRSMPPLASEPPESRVMSRERRPLPVGRGIIVAIALSSAGVATGYLVRRPDPAPLSPRAPTAQSPVGAATIQSSSSTNSAGVGLNDPPARPAALPSVPSLAPSAPSLAAPVQSPAAAPPTRPAATREGTHAPPSRPPPPPPPNDAGFDAEAMLRKRI